MLDLQLPSLPRPDGVHGDSDAGGRLGCHSTMSYVLKIWESPLPASVIDADRICTALQLGGGAANPKYLELAARLTARYPDINDRDDDDDDDPGVWTDGPLAGNARSAVLGIGVQTHALGEVLPFLIESARALGLLVYDTQAAALHLADGRVLGLVGRSAGTSPTPQPERIFVSRAQAREGLRAALRPVLTAQGFKPMSKDFDFRLQTEAARFTVQIAFDSSGNGHNLYVNTTVTPDCQHPLLARFYPQGTDFSVHHYRLAAAQGLAWPDMEKSTGGLMYIESPADVERAGALWAQLFERAILPLIARCHTRQGLCDELIDNMEAFSHLYFALVLAAVHGRTDLPQIAQRLKKIVFPHLHDILDARLAELSR